MGFITNVMSWMWVGVRHSLAMAWMMTWPLAFGFSASGVIQALVPRNGLRTRLGRTTPGTVAFSSLLGVVSSSCSYAASAMAKTLFSRGASWTNSLVFMVASTNLVVELGVAMYVMLGGTFVEAQIIGGVIMVGLIAVLTPLFFSRARRAELRDRIEASSEFATTTASRSPRSVVRDPATYQRAARYTIGDLTMLRGELLIGFLAAGFLSAHVPSSWWSTIFWSGHGGWTVVENCLVAPLLAVVSFVCSVGNIPLAATLWMRGVGFGGVIAFIFADLITFPLILIYRRFYGWSAALRLAGMLWLVISATGLLINGLFDVTHRVPTMNMSAMMRGDFTMGYVAWLNVVAVVLLAFVYAVSRTKVHDASVATDPICGMTVDTSAPAATRTVDGVTYYFCAPRCADRFDKGHEPDLMHEDVGGDETDPICGMRVDSTTCTITSQRDGRTYYFCCEACQTQFETGEVDEQPVRIELGLKPRRPVS